MPNNDQPRILVTGGAGFIGSALVWALNLRGEERILISDRLESDGKWRNLVPLKYTDYIDADDLLNRLRRGRILEGIETVFHLGACSSTTEQDGTFLMRNNFEYTKRLARWALGRGIRFVYASSAATYGDGSLGMSDQDEIEPLRPLNMYGYSKHLFDLYAKRQGFSEKMVGIKYFNVFGPNEDHKADMRSMVHKACHQIQTTGEVKLFKSHHPDYEDGKQMRDFVYVKDAVRMTLHLADTASAGGLFNIGSGKANTWIDLADATFKALDKPSNISFVDMPELLREKYQYFTQANIDKLIATGYKENISSLEDAVADYVTNYLVADKRLGDEDC